MRERFLCCLDNWECSLSLFFVKPCLFLFRCIKGNTLFSNSFFSCTRSFIQVIYSFFLFYDLCVHRSVLNQI